MREKATADRNSRAKRVLKSHRKEQRRTPSRAHEGFAATSLRPTVTLEQARAKTRIAEAEAASR